VKKLAFILFLLAAPAFADEPAKPLIWVMAIQLKAATLSLTYPSEAACKASVKVAMEHMKAIGRADCFPVIQP
jgi:hypothetical protein